LPNAVVLAHKRELRGLPCVVIGVVVPPILVPGENWNCWSPDPSPTPTPLYPPLPSPPPLPPPLPLPLSIEQRLVLAEGGSRRVKLELVRPLLVPQVRARVRVRVSPVRILPLPLPLSLSLSLSLSPSPSPSPPLSLTPTLP
jgi:hypothetical protein